MNKIDRNDPCPCASGKKYKHCCAKSNVIPFRAPHLDEELEVIHHELIEFAITHYEDELDTIIQEYIETNIMNRESTDVETYANLLIGWIIIFEPLIDNKTVLEIFSEQAINKVRNKRIQRAFANWEQAIPAIFKITSVDYKDDDIVIVENIFTGKTHKIKHATPQMLHVDDYIIGTLLPFFHHEQFIFIATLISSKNELQINDLLKIYDPEVEQMTEIFPEWLGDLIDPDEDELLWSDYEYKRVADIFAKQMDVENVDQAIIDTGLYFWNIFCYRNNPYVPKAATYAAGLHYLIVNLLTDDRVTQAEIANRYNVSPTTISTRYHSFIKEFDAILMEYKGF